MKLHEIAKYLYENETITGEEFMKILNDKKTMEYLGITDWFFTASRYPARRHVHGVQAVFWHSARYTLQS